MAFGRLGAMGRGFGKEGAGVKAGQSGPIVQPLRSAVSRAMVGQGFVSGLGGTSVQGQSRMRMVTGDAPLSEIRVVYGNWGGAGEVAGPGNLVVEAALECDGPLGVVQFKWSGVTSVTIAAGTTVTSDAILPAAFGLTVFPANFALWFRTGCTAVSNAGFPFSVLITASGEGTWAGPAFTSQVNATGPMTTPSGGATAAGMLTPFAVLGRYTVAMPTLADIGDSISAGINDSAITIAQGQLTGNGYVGRAAATNGGAHTYPTFKLGIGGDGANSGYTQRATLFQYATHGLTGWGVNDINGGATAASVFANFVTAWAAMKSAGISNIFAALVTPKTTSTDSWATEANQTYFNAAFTPGGARDQLNTLINASVGSNNLTGVCNFLSAVQGVDPSKWIVTGAANFATNDGLHPSAVIHANIAPTLQATVISVGQQLPTPDNSWVPTGIVGTAGAWAINFKTGQQYGISPYAYMIEPWTGSANNGTNRSSVGYGVTANNSTGTLVQFGPNTARVTPSRGLLAEKTTTNLAASPFSPATQTITVVNATQYTASIVGPGSMVLSGAGSGTVTAGSPVTFTSAGTSLTCTISGVPLSMQVETGSVATSPISGTRAAEDVGIPNDVNSFNTFSLTQGTYVVAVEGSPPPISPILGAFGTHYLNVATNTTINNNKTTTVTANLGAGANNRTVMGLAWDGTGRGIGGNAGTIASDGSAIGAGLAQIYLGGEGNGGGNSKLNGYVQMLFFYPTRLTTGTTPTFAQATTP